MDAAGNASLTNSIKFVYAVVPSADWAPESLNGLTARVTSGTDSLANVSFDISTFSQTGAGTNLDDYGLGAYVYSRTGTNTGLLTLTNTVPQIPFSRGKVRLVVKCSIPTSGTDAPTPPTPPTVHLQERWSTQRR